MWDEENERGRFKVKGGKVKAGRQLVQTQELGPFYPRTYESMEFEAPLPAVRTICRR